MASKKTDTIIIPIQIDENGLNRVNENINETVQVTKSLKSQLKEMTMELQGLEPGSARFYELTAAAGQLKDQINDTNAAIKATAGSATENLAKGLSNVAGVGIAGMQGLASATALFGVESEDVQKTLVKLQALAGLGDAVKSLGSLGDTMTEVKASFMAAATQLGLFTTAKEVDVAVTGVQTVATEGATVATATLGATMNALPIIAIIAGLTAIVGAIAYFATQSEEATITQEEFNEVATETGKAIGEAKQNVNEVGLAFQNAGKGVGSKKKALELYNDKFGETLGIAKTYEQAEATFVKNADIYIQVSGLRAKADAFRALSAKASADAFVAAQNVELTTMDIIELAKTKFLKGDKAALKEGMQLAINNRKAAEVESNKRIKALDAEANKFSTQATELESELVTIKEEGDKKKVTSSKKTAEEISKIQSEANAKYIEAEDAKFKLENELTLSETEKKKLALQQAYDKQVEIAGDDENLIKLATKKLQSDLNQIDVDAKSSSQAILDKQESARIAKEDAEWLRIQQITLEKADYDKLVLQQKYDDEVAAAEGNAVLQLELKNKLESDLNAIDVEAANKTKELNIKSAQDTLDIAAQGLNSIQGLSDVIFSNKMSNLKKGSKEEEAMARKQFNLNKTLQLGGAIIDGSKAVMASLAASPVAIGVVPNPTGIASLAFVAAATLANIAKISSAQFNGGGGGGNTPSPSIPTSTDTTSTSGAATPSFNLFGSGGQQNNVGGNGSNDSNQNITVTAVVSETDITNVQNKIKGIKTNSEL